jgi:hypothetical protein
MTASQTEYEQMWALVREGKFVTDPEFKPGPMRAETVREGRLTRQLGVKPIPNLAEGFGGRQKEGKFAWPTPVHNDALGFGSPCSRFERDADGQVIGRRR